ncbi:MAG: hypothetical protein DMG27_01910 [Acidobacteria bacterium]|nr:MAG: hypothetical protein DMG27_01910 [Acidobacteriota bacterium]
MDSYISGEFSIEVILGVSRHLESCNACADELEARSRLRNRLRHAVRQDAGLPRPSGKGCERL